MERPSAATRRSAALAIGGAVRARGHRDEQERSGPHATGTAAMALQVRSVGGDERAVEERRCRST